MGVLASPLILFSLVTAGCNRPFPSSLLSLFKNESKSETFHMKMSSACRFIFMQIKVFFIRMVLHLDSLYTEAQRNSEVAYCDEREQQVLFPEFCTCEFCSSISNQLKLIFKSLVTSRRDYSFPSGYSFPLS